MVKNNLHLKRSVEGVVKPKISNKRKFFLRIVKLVNSFLKRPYLKKVGIGLASFLFVFLVTYLVSNRRSEADFAKFNPSTCLGNWYEPIKSTGEVKDGDLVSETNSALARSTESLYCGDFKGQIPQDKEAKRYIMNVYYDSKDMTASILEDESLIKDAEKKILEQKSEEFLNDKQDQGSSAPKPEKKELIDSPLGTEKDNEPVQDSEQVSPIEQKTEIDTAEDQPAPESPSSTSDNSTDSGQAADSKSDSSIQSLRDIFIGQTVYAQEVPLEESVPLLVAGDSEAVIPSSEQDIVDSNEEKNDMEVVTQETSIVYVADVLYTLDGATWTELGKLTAGQQKESFPFPLIQWNEISKVQIKVVPLIDVGNRTLLVDGFQLDVEYDSLEEISSESDQKKYTLLDLKTFSEQGGNTYFFKRKNEGADQGEMISLSSKKPASVVFYNVSEKKSVFETVTTDQELVVPTYTLLLGDYQVYLSDDFSYCLENGLVECLLDKKAIASFSIKPSVKTPSNFLSNRLLDLNQTYTSSDNEEIVKQKEELIKKDDTSDLKVSNQEIEKNDIPQKEDEEQLPDSQNSTQAQEIEEIQKDSTSIDILKDIDSGYLN